ncbi:MAG: hypothetical protein HPY79_11990, partial [Bacteroidales bacterium]|nr:hypothetical protein [Bacteroidales bacterium]
MKTIVLLLAIIISIPLAYSQTFLTVTKTTDPDPFEHPFNVVDSLCDTEMYGTLQWAIRKANTIHENYIVINFNIPGTGTHDIMLNYELPMIINDFSTIIIDGTSQQGYSFGSPVININGQNILGSCFQAYKTNISIKGLSIENFLYHGIVISTPLSSNEISENVINHIENGVNNTATVGIRVLLAGIQWTNIYGNFIGTGSNSTNIENYGIMIENSHYVNIGGTLQNQPNTITNCGTRGIFLSSSNYIRMSGNRIYNNPIAIWTLGSNNDKLPPVITSYQNDTLSGTSAPGDIIEVFEGTGAEQANEYLGSTTTDGYGNWQLPIQTTYQYVVATATDENNNTSGFSLLKEVKTCMYSVCFEAPGHPYCSDANPDPSWCKEKTICLGEPVTIYFCEMCGGINEWHVDINGEHGISGTYDFTQVTNYGQYEVWQTTFTPTIAGNYNLVLYVYNEISNTNNPYYLSLIVLPPPTPTITQSPNLCQGNTSVLNAGIGYSSYLWNTGATTQTITISQPGTYFVTVTDAHGCTGIGTINVIQYDSPTLTITGNTNICSGGTSILTAQTNATSYLWSNNSTSQSITVNQGGTYSVTVTSSQGCTNTASVTVTQSPTINVNASFTPVSCYHGNNGTATVNATGGIPPFQYIWSNGQTTQTIFNLTAGTYAVTVTDANGCTATTQVVITQPSAIQYTASITSVSCFAGNDGSISLTVSGGTPFFENFPYYLYQWNTGATSSFLTNLISGTYYCTITDANNCTTVATVFVPQPQKITATFSTNPPTCYGYNNGSITINVNGGTPQYSYNWNTGATGNPINHLIAGNYTVTVTDANHCTAVFNTSLNQPPLLTLNVSSYTPSLCGNETNGSITVVANGGNIPYTYNIGNGAQTSNVFQ